MCLQTTLSMVEIIFFIFWGIVALFIADMAVTADGDEYFLQMFVRKVGFYYRRLKIGFCRLTNENYDKEIRERKINCLSFLLAELLLADFDYEKESRNVISDCLEKYYDPDFVLQVGKQLDYYLYSDELKGSSRNTFYNDIKRLYSKIERHYLLDMIHEIGAVGGINEQEWNLLLTVSFEFGLDGRDRDFYYYKYYRDKKERSTASETKKEDTSKRQQKKASKNHKPNNLYSNNGVYYAVLGLPDGASADEVKAAYRSLSKKWHPDTILDENLKKLYTQRFIEVSEAYKKLIK